MADETDPEERERSLYLAQIKQLDEELKWCELECTELEKQNKDLISLCSHLVIDKKDITEYLEYAAAAEEEKIVEMTELLENELQAFERDKEMLNLQNSRKMQELQQCIDELTSVNKTLVETCDEQKTQLAELINTEEQLLVQQRNQKETFLTALTKLVKDTQMETQRIIDELKQTMQVKASDIVQGEKAQYNEILKQLDAALTEQSNLQGNFQHMRVRVQSLCSEKDKLNKCLDRTVQVENQLRTQCKELEKHIENCCMKQQRLQAGEEHLRQEIDSVSEQCREKTAKAGQAKAELQMETSRRRQLENLVKEAIIILRQVVASPRAVDDIPGELQRLMKVLESGTPQGASVPDGKALTPDVSAEKSAADSPAASAEILDIDKDPCFLLARCRPGDLIPPPQYTLKTVCPPGASNKKKSTSVDPDAAPSSCQLLEKLEKYML